MTSRTLLVLPLIAALCAAGCGSTSKARRPPVVYPLARQHPLPAGVPPTTQPNDPFYDSCIVDRAQPPWLQLNVNAAGKPDALPVTGPVYLGSLMSVCASQQRTDLPVDATITSDHGPAIHHRWPAGVFMNLPWTFLAAGAVGVGHHVLTIRWPDDTQRKPFDVVADPPPPGLWSDAAGGARFAGETVNLASAGNRAGARVDLDVYRADSKRVFRYFTTIGTKADKNGIAVLHIPTRPADRHLYQFVQRDWPGRSVLISLAAKVVGGARAPGRHDPPRGVPSQFAYFQQGGPGSCPEAPAGIDTPIIVLGRDEPRTTPGDEPDAQPSAFEIGDHVRVCALHFTAGRPAQLRVIGPNGTKMLHYPAEIVNQDIGYQLLIDDTSTEGDYRLEVRQGDLRAGTSFSVSDPTVPGYLATTTPDGRPEVLVVGLPPHQRFWLAQYQAPTDVPTRDDFASVAMLGFLSATPVRVDTRGIIGYVPRVTPGAGGCPIVKVVYGEHVLDDIANTTSNLCPDGEQGSEPRLG